MSLTKRSIDAAVYEGDGKSWDLRPDGTIPDFYLRLYPSGRKSYVLRYRIGSCRRLFTVGNAGELTLSQARKLAAQNRLRIRAGGDPLRERRASRESVQDGPGATTFAQQALKYLRHRSKPERASWREDARRLGYRWDETEESFQLDEMKRARGESSGQIVQRLIGQKRLVDVDVSDVLKIKEEISKRGRVEANRVRELIRAVINTAVEWRDLPPDSDNPAVRVKRFEERSRQRWVKPEELPRLVEAIQAQSNQYVRAALWLYLLTGLRRRELLSAKWNEVNPISGILTLPKTKNGTSREVQLAPAAIAIIQSLPRVEGNPHLFPGRRDGRPLVNIDKPWREVRTSAGLDDLRIHDLRRTVGSLLASSGVSLGVIADVLGHSDQRATQIYAKIHEDVTRTTIETHADSLLDLVGVSLGEITGRPADGA